ncbi:MAG: orotidine-5'-phosphate decarboxylase [Bacteroidetes bacterium]|nr:orotidine-5'-phosphate decarboxylase [Bacteroidota bacterium]
MERKKLVEIIFEKKSFLCVGLDSDIDKIPHFLRSEKDPIFSFNKEIIDATIDYAVAYKPNMAFYESLGSKGWASLEKTMDYLKSKSPDIFTIADAKRGDIGNTAEMYAKAFFDNLGFDSVTINPYMGSDSITPFLSRKGKWAIILGITSNKGAEDFQFLDMNQGSGKKLYAEVIDKAMSLGSDENIMFVAGATQANLLVKIREIVPSAFLLVPGVGAQGGSLQEVCRYGMTKDCGLLVNASRSILYASNKNDFSEKARNAAQELQNEMSQILDNK